jgi:hypothetical protein
VVWKMQYDPAKSSFLCVKSRSQRVFVVINSSCSCCHELKPMTSLETKYSLNFEKPCFCGGGGETNTRMALYNTLASYCTHLQDKH